MRKKRKNSDLLFIRSDFSPPRNRFRMMKIKVTLGMGFM